MTSGNEPVGCRTCAQKCAATDEHGQCAGQPLRPSAQAAAGRSNAEAAVQDGVRRRSRGRGIFQSSQRADMTTRLRQQRGGVERGEQHGRRNRRRGAIRALLPILAVLRAEILRGAIRLYCPIHLFAAQGSAICPGIVSSDKFARILGDGYRNKRLVLIPVEKSSGGDTRTGISSHGQLRKQQRTGQHATDLLFDGTTLDHVFTNANSQKLYSDQGEMSRQQEFATGRHAAIRF